MNKEKIDLRQFYKFDKCPICGKALVYNFYYTEVNCIDYKCQFNEQEKMYLNGKNI